MDGFCFLGGFVLRCKSRFRSPRWHYFCSVERKSNQKRPFPQRAERSHNHRQSLYKLIFILQFLLTFSAFFSRYLSVIIPFLLCASRELFSHISAFRKAYIKLHRSFVLSLGRVNRLPRFAVPTLYHLSTRQSMVAGFVFWLVVTGLVCYY